MERRDRMKHTQRSFSFLMEFVIILFFFALAATICAGFLLKAKEKEATAILIAFERKAVLTKMWNLHNINYMSKNKKQRTERVTDCESSQRGNVGG